MKGFETLQWHGIFGPRGMPAETVNRLNNEIRQILLRPDVREKFAPEGADVIASSPDRFAAFMASETKSLNEENQPRLATGQHRGVGIDVSGGTPEEFGSRIRADLEKWSRAVKAAGIKPD